LHEINNPLACWGLASGNVHLPEARNQTPRPGYPAPVDASPAPLALVLSSPAPLGPLDLEPARRFAASASAPETRRAYARE